MDITCSKLLKKLYICVCALAFIFLCACAADMYLGKRPTDYPGSKWVCDEPDIVFMIDESGMVSSCEINGEALRKGCFLAFGPGTVFRLHDNQSGITLFRGESEYSSEKMYVDVELDDFFGGVYTGQRIVFYRIE